MIIYLYKELSANKHNITIGLTDDDLLRLTEGQELDLNHAEFVDSEGNKLFGRTYNEHFVIKRQESK